jgi:DNA-3-methyladenine glycosylase I
MKDTGGKDKPMDLDDRSRCGWMGSDELMGRYHDEEWGVPVHEDRRWFEYIVLDAFQAGLSWRTVLHKRAAFRKVFHGFDPVRVARMTEKAMEKASQNPAIIRNRLKIRAAVNNAAAFLNLQKKTVPSTTISGRLPMAGSFTTTGGNWTKFPPTPCFRIPSAKH